MPECCTQLDAIPAHRPGAVTPRQMVVEKSPHQVLVDALDVQLALIHPAPEVGKATEVLPDGFRCVAPFSKGNA